MTTNTADRVPVLDYGYVRLVGVLGDDLTPVNAARVSFDKESSYDPETGGLRERDKRLLRYLAEQGHTSPFRHAVLSFEVYAPLMVMRQWGKYRVGSTWTFEDGADPLETWNESSRRYVTEEPVFYIPEPGQWRSAPEDKKQGSGNPVDQQVGKAATSVFKHVTTVMEDHYRQAMERGICPEQARLFLPAYAMYVRARWTVSLHGVLHFLQQRLHDDAQWEIREFACAVAQLTQEHFPVCTSLWGVQVDVKEAT